MPTLGAGAYEPGASQPAAGRSAGIQFNLPLILPTARSHLQIEHCRNSPFFHANQTQGKASQTQTKTLAGLKNKKENTRTHTHPPCPDQSCVNIFPLSLIITIYRDWLVRPRLICSCVAGRMSAWCLSTCKPFLPVSSSCAKPITCWDSIPHQRPSRLIGVPQVTGRGRLELFGYRVLCSSLVNSIFSFANVQRRAKASSCDRPDLHCAGVLAFLPLFFSLLLLTVHYGFRPLQKSLPQWLRRFAVEPDAPSSGAAEVTRRADRRLTKWTLALVGLSITSILLVLGDGLVRRNVYASLPIVFVLPNVWHPMTQS